MIREKGRHQERPNEMLAQAGSLVLAARRGSLEQARLTPLSAAAALIDRGIIQGMTDSRP
jgi:hypothetical protein